jgi:hypothetical protein
VKTLANRTNKGLDETMASLAGSDKAKYTHIREAKTPKQKDYLRKIYLKSMDALNGETK